MLLEYRELLVEYLYKVNIVRLGSIGYGIPFTIWNLF